MAARGRFVAVLLIFVGIPLAVLSGPREPSASSSASSASLHAPTATAAPRDAGSDGVTGATGRSEATDAVAGGTDRSEATSGAVDAGRAARSAPARTGSPGVSSPADTGAATDPATPASTGLAADPGTPAGAGGTVDPGTPAGTGGTADPGTPADSSRTPSPGSAANVPASGAAGETPPAGSSVPAAGEGPAVHTHEITLESGRSYDLRTTAQATPPRPLVVLLHAYAHDAAAMQDISGATPFADAHDFALAYGHSVGGAWNAGSCCAGTGAVDDVAYLRELVADASRRTPVDPRRIYVWGYSNGGMMAARAVCEAPDVFSAAGVVAGHLLVPCDQTPIRMIHIHGTDDTTVPWRGGWSDYVHATFPDARTESARVTTSSTVLGVPWMGGHTWPWWATGALWEFSDQPVPPARRPSLAR